MKILSISNYFYVFGGAERVCFNIRELLKQNGHDVIDFSMHHGSNIDSKYSKYFARHVDFTDRGNVINNIRRGPSVIYNKEAKLKLKKLISDTKPDVALVHNVGRRLSNSVFDALSEGNVPIAHMLHDYKPVCSINSFFRDNGVCEKCINHNFAQATLNRCNRGSFSASIFDSLEKYYHWSRGTYDQIELYIAPSEFIKNKLYEGGLEKGKIEVIPHFIEITNKKSLSSKDYAIFFGRIDYGKGVETLISAFKELPSYKIKIVGDGPLKDKLEEEAKDINNIEFTGRLPFGDLMRLVDNAKFVIVPSEWYEVFGMVIIEAMSRGKPVIGSDTGGITELIVDGKNGYLFSPGNVKELQGLVAKLYDDEDRIIKMGSYAYENVKKKYNKEKYYKSLINNLEKIKESNAR